MERLAAVEELAVRHRDVVDARHMVDVTPVDLLRTGACLVAVAAGPYRHRAECEFGAVLDPAQLAGQGDPGDASLSPPPLLAFFGIPPPPFLIVYPIPYTPLHPP